MGESRSRSDGWPRSSVSDARTAALADARAKRQIGASHHAVPLSSILESQRLEEQRIIDLYLDEAKNPQDYAPRTAPLAKDGSCSFCGATFLTSYTDYYGVTTWSCWTCGQDYFLDAEPIPVLVPGPKTGTHWSVGEESLVGEKALEAKKAYDIRRQNRAK